MATNVIVVDNASSDHSVSNIEELFPTIKVIRNPENKGFGFACNQGSKCCQSRYILFLNPDTTINPGSLAVPLQFLEISENANYAACGIQMMNEQGKVSQSCDRFPNILHFMADILGLSKLFPKLPLGIHISEWDHKESRDVDHIIGAFYLIRRSVFETIGGYDERFFVYWEDIDLSKQIHDMEYKIRYISDALCFHKGGGTSEYVKAFRLFYFLKSKILYGFKHLNIIPAIILFIATIFIEPFSRLIFSITNLSINSIKDLFKAYTLLFYSIPEIFKKIQRR